jgi:hypothetical protein
MVCDIGKVAIKKTHSKNIIKTYEEWVEWEAKWQGDYNHKKRSFN